MLSLHTRRRRVKTTDRTIALPIHPCAALHDWVSAVLTMCWDDELEPAERERLLDQIAQDPASSAYAKQIQADEALLRSAFSYLAASKADPVCAA